MKRILKRGILAIALLYLLVCLVVMIFPRAFFYHPAADAPNIMNAREYDYPAHEVKYTSSDGTPLFAWYTPQEPGKKMIVFMHGNAGNIEGFYHKLKSFSYDGFGTFLPEYRGFGGIKGKINQKNLESDALAAVKFLKKNGLKNEDIYLYGMSLGSHMAIHTAHELQNEGAFGGVILEVPFDSLAHTAQKRVPFLPFNFLIFDKYDNLKEIKNIKSPILILGAQKDKIVPVELAESLYKQASDPKKMIIYKNGSHNNLFNFRNDLDILNWIELNEKGIY